MERAGGPEAATDGEYFLEAGPPPDGLATSRRTGFCCTEEAGTTGLRAAAAALGASSVLFGLITLAGRLLIQNNTRSA